MEGQGLGADCSEEGSSSAAGGRKRFHWGRDVCVHLPYQGYRLMSCLLDTKVKVNSVWSFSLCSLPSPELVGCINQNQFSFLISFSQDHNTFPKLRKFLHYHLWLGLGFEMGFWSSFHWLLPWQMRQLVIVQQGITWLDGWCPWQEEFFPHSGPLHGIGEVSYPKSKSRNLQWSISEHSIC